MAGLLGDALSWIDSKKRIAADRLAQLATDPSGLLGRAGYDIKEQVMPFINAAEQGDTPKVIEGLLGSNLVSPLIFAGVGAKTANKGLLAQAQQMTKEGADPGTVWRTTGWTDQFPDKKWRFEIPDDKSYIPATNPNASISNVIEDTRWMGATSPRAVLKHEQMNANYPDVMQMVLNDIPMDAPAMRGARGMYIHPSNVYLASELSANEAKPVLLHELQHAVQQREGFAKGGSPEGMYSETRKGLESQLKFLQDRLTRLHEDLVSEDKWKRDFATTAIPKTKAELDSLSAKIGSSSPDTYDAYKRLAGEAEARLVQQRMNLTPEQRRMMPPWLSFDVPPEQQIVKY